MYLLPEGSRQVCTPLLDTSIPDAVNPNKEIMASRIIRSVQSFDTAAAYHEKD
jgi:hypothetical protein